MTDYLTEALHFQDELTSQLIDQGKSMSNPKMDPVLKARWLEALRSGKYKQGMRALRSPCDEFCCLGVLCDLYSEKGWSEDFDLSVGGYTYTNGPRSDFELPPSNLAGTWGLDWEVEVDIGGTLKTLYDHNDAGRTFAEIADAIEAQL